MLSDNLARTISDNNERAQHAYEMLFYSRARTTILHQMARTDDPFERDELFLALRENGASFLAAREKITNLSVDPESQRLLDLQRHYSSIAGPIQYEVIDLLNEDRTDEAIDMLIERVIPAQDQALKAIDSFIGLQQAQNQQSLESTTHEFDRFFKMIIILTLTGVIIGVMVAGGVFRRITSIMQALYHSEVREKVIRENIADAVVTFNKHGVIESCNKAVSEIFGYQASEIIGEEVIKLFSVHDFTHYGNELNIHQLTHIINATRQVEGRHKNGSGLFLHVGLSKVVVNKEPIYIAVLSDITDQIKAEESLRQLNEELELRVEKRTLELKQANEKLKYLASHDTVTSLPNRALLNEHLTHILAGAKRLSHKVAIFFLDIDGFKQVNDAYGHEVGDYLLREIGSRLTSTLRKSDLVARVGGDEFIVVFDDVNSESPLIAMAHKLIDLIGSPFDIQGKICNIGVSIGISIYPQDGTDVESLIRCADQAMYKIKSSGKNNLYFYKNIAQGQ